MAVLTAGAATGVFTDGDDLDGLFLPEELLSDDGSAGLPSGCKKFSQNNTITSCADRNVLFQKKSMPLLPHGGTFLLKPFL